VRELNDDDDDDDDDDEDQKFRGHQSIGIMNFVT